MDLKTSFEEFENKKIDRRKLLPWWIKMFCWIFMFMGLVSSFSIFFRLMGWPNNMTIYGFESHDAFSLMGILIFAVLLFKGITSYFLYFEKNEAILFAKIDAIVGIILCLVSMIYPFLGDNEGVSFSFRFEILFLFSFFRKIEEIELKWKQN